MTGCDLWCMDLYRWPVVVQHVDSPHRKISMDCTEVWTMTVWIATTLVRRMVGWLYKRHIWMVLMTADGTLASTVESTDASR
jgi:hypothetical protein